MQKTVILELANVKTAYSLLKVSIVNGVEKAFLAMLQNNSANVNKNILNRKILININETKFVNKYNKKKHVVVIKTELRIIAKHIVIENQAFANAYQM